MRLLPPRQRPPIADFDRDTVAAWPDRPVIPYAAAIEAMAVSRQPVMARSPSSPAARALGDLWIAIERALTQPA